MAVLLLLLIITGIAYLILLMNLRRHWKGLREFRPGSENARTFISVIIPARNEEQHLPHLLKALKEQSYPSSYFEVIVVDDHSTDNTASVVANFSAHKIKLVSLQEITGSASLNSYKKKAIEAAINVSRGELIVTTDADCSPPEKWLETIAKFYEKNSPAFIAAPVSINCTNRFFEMFQSLDFMSLQGVTGAAVSGNLMNMCNGANMAYTRKAYNAVNGFENIDAIASGDDMLLMQKISAAFPEKTAFLYSQDAIVQTAPVKNIKEFFSQRIRWASKTAYYKDKRITTVLVLIYLLNLLLLAFPVASIFFPYEFIISGKPLNGFILWASVILLKIISEIIFLIPVARFFQKQNMLWIFPLMQPFHILYTVIAGFAGTFSTYEWKGRKVK